MPNLKSIKIGKKCFKYIHSFILENLPNLEKIEIGDECFTVGSVKRKEGCFTIAECSNLQSIEIGEKSFRDYNSFNLSHLPSLSSIHIKASSFSLTPAFELKGKQRCFNDISQQIFLCQRLCSWMVVCSSIVSLQCLTV